MGLWSTELNFCGETTEKLRNQDMSGGLRCLGCSWDQALAPDFDGPKGHLASDPGLDRQLRSTRLPIQSAFGHSLRVQGPK